MKIFMYSVREHKK